MSFPEIFRTCHLRTVVRREAKFVLQGSCGTSARKNGEMFWWKNIIQLNGGFAMKPTKRTVKRGKAYTRYTINHPEVRFIHRYTLELICVIAKWLLPWKVTLIGSAAKPFWDEYQGAMFWVESLCYVRWGYQDRLFKQYTGIYSKASRYGYLSSILLDGWCNLQLGATWYWYDLRNHLFYNMVS